MVDLACCHGLLAQIMLILDQASPLALAVDTHIPKSVVTPVNRYLQDLYLH